MSPFIDYSSPFSTKQCDVLRKQVKTKVYLLKNKSQVAHNTGYGYGYRNSLWNAGLSLQSPFHPFGRRRTKLLYHRPPLISSPSVRLLLLRASLPRIYQQGIPIVKKKASKRDCHPSGQSNYETVTYLANQTMRLSPIWPIKLRDCHPSDQSNYKTVTHLANQITRLSKKGEGNRIIPKFQQATHSPLRTIYPI